MVTKQEIRDKANLMLQEVRALRAQMKQADDGPRYIVEQVGMNYGGDMYAVKDTHAEGCNIVCRVDIGYIHYADRICRLLNAVEKEGSDA